MTDFAQIADEHAGLLQKVSEYDHAPAELRETEDLLKALEDDLQTREARLEQLRKKRKSEHKDIDKLQRSSTRRFFTRLKEGKDGLDKILQKEEREYMEAAQDEHNENKTVQELKATVQTSREKIAELKDHISTRKEMLKRLDEIYKSAFDGPSPDFPEEDDAEQEVQHAEQHYDELQARLNHEKNAFGILDRAAFYANEALTAIQSANRNATYDTFLGGGLWAQMAESDDLLKTQGCANMSVNLIKRAHKSQPLVNEVECGTIANPDWIHTMFDNLYTDFMFQKKIEQSVRTIAAFQRSVYQECSKSEARTKSLDREAKEAHEFLRSRRRQLVATRREILRRVKEDGGIRVIGISPDAPGPELPSYMRQAEEGTRVLARGVERAPSTDDTAPPPEYSSPRIDPLPPSRTLHEGDAVVSSPVSATQQETPTQRFPTDGKAWPEINVLASPERFENENAEIRMPSMPEVGAPSDQAGPSSIAHMALLSQSAPTRSATHSTGRSIDSDDLPLSHYVLSVGPPGNTGVETALNASEMPNTSRGRYAPPPGPPPSHVINKESELPPLPNEGPSSRRISVRQTGSHSPSPQRLARMRSTSNSPLPSPPIEVSRIAEPQALSWYEPRTGTRYAPPPCPPPGHTASARSPSIHSTDNLPLGVGVQVQIPIRHESTLSVSTSTRSPSPYQNPQRPSSALASSDAQPYPYVPKHRPTASMSSAFPQPFSSSPTRTTSIAGPGPIGWVWDNANNGSHPERDVSDSIRRLSIAPGPSQQRARSASPSYSAPHSNSRPLTMQNHQQKPSFASNNPYRLFTEA